MKHEEARCFVVQCGAEKFIFAMKTVSFRFGKVTRTACMAGRTSAVDSAADQRTGPRTLQHIAHGEGHDRITCTTVHVGACYVASSSRVWWPVPYNGTGSITVSHQRQFLCISSPALTSIHTSPTHVCLCPTLTVAFS